jgi:hypothetical protein
VRRHGIERGIVALGRVEQLFEPRAEKEQRHIRISGRSPDWLKSKNPACEAARREAEEEWGK